mgnify:CR=1 FL=1
MTDLKTGLAPLAAKFPATFPGRVARGHGLAPRSTRMRMSARLRRSARRAFVSAIFRLRKSSASAAFPEARAIRIAARPKATAAADPRQRARASWRSTAWRRWLTDQLRSKNRPNNSTMRPRIARAG